MWPSLFFFFFFANAAPTGLRQKQGATQKRGRALEKGSNLRRAGKAEAETVPTNSSGAVCSLELSPRVGPRKCDDARMPLVGSDDGCPTPGPPATDTLNGNPARHFFKCAGDFARHDSVCSRSNRRTREPNPANVKGTPKPGRTWSHMGPSSTQSLTHVAVPEASLSR